MRIKKSIAALAIIAATRCRRARARRRSPSKPKLRLGRGHRAARDRRRRRLLPCPRHARQPRPRAGQRHAAHDAHPRPPAVPGRPRQQRPSSDRRCATIRVRIELTVPPTRSPAATACAPASASTGAPKSSCKRSRPLVVTNATPTPTPTPTPTASPRPARRRRPPRRSPSRCATPSRSTACSPTCDAFQDIADANGGNRAAGSPGYDASLAYVKSTLEAAGYTTATQTFDFVAYEENAPSLLERTDVDPDVTIESQTLDYSPSGDVDGRDPDGHARTSRRPARHGRRRLRGRGLRRQGLHGQDRADPARHVRRRRQGRQRQGGRRRSAWSSSTPATPTRPTATASPPSRSARTPASRSSASPTPTARRSAPAAPKTVHLVTDTTLTPTTTSNLIADTAGGNPDRTVVVGSHLDSVPAGPGINDNGTGSAFNLELALQMAKLGVAPKNKVRFAWWGAEEAGLVGSNHYVEQLTLEDAQKISANLNFDMLGSPNYIRYVYDGDGDAFDAGGPGRLRPDRAGLQRLLRGPEPGHRADRLRRPVGLRRLHRRRHPRGRPVLGRRGREDPGGVDDLRRHPERRRSTRTTTRPATRSTTSAARATASWARAPRT